MIGTIFRTVFGGIGLIAAAVVDAIPNSSNRSNSSGTSDDHGTSGADREMERQLQASHDRGNHSGCNHD